jgi:Spy/CpxP family protein refolding chaperone
MSIELELTEEQSAQLLEIFTAADAERETLSEQHRLDMCSLRDVTNAQIEDILTAEQSVRLAEMKTQMEMRRGEKRAQQGRNHSQRPDCDA